MGPAKRAIRGSARGRIAELAPPPTWIEPQLCKLVTAVPSGDGWAHEVKFDGYRMHARIVGGEVALLTRTGLDWTAKYPGVAAALAGLKCGQAYIDGELCAVGADGLTSFASLQGHGQKPASLVYFAFDLLHLDGADLVGRLLLERKDRLGNAAAPGAVGGALQQPPDRRWAAGLNSLINEPRRPSAFQQRTGHPLPWNHASQHYVCRVIYMFAHFTNILGVANCFVSN